MRTFVMSLMQCGFKSMGGSENGITNLYVIINNMPHVLSIVDCDGIEMLTPQFCKSVPERIRGTFAENGYSESRVLSIYLTNNVTAAKSIIPQGEEYWIFHKADNRLYIYEDGPEEFLDIRPRLENRAASRAPKKKKPSIKVLTVTNLLILMNVLAFILVYMNSAELSVDTIFRYGGIYARVIFEEGQIYRLVMAMFLHYNVVHIASNMVVLYLEGKALASYYGGLRFALIYIVGGIFAGLGSAIYYYVSGGYVVAAGASGAVCAVIGALIAVGISDKDAGPDIQPVPLILYSIYLIHNGLMSSTVDNAAHITGLLAGFVIGLVMTEWRKRRRCR